MFDSKLCAGCYEKSFAVKLVASSTATPTFLSVSSSLSMCLLCRLFLSRLGINHPASAFFCHRHQVEGFADDYAFLIRGLIDLYEADPRRETGWRWLRWARELQVRSFVAVVFGSALICLYKHEAFLMWHLVVPSSFYKSTKLC